MYTNIIYVLATGSLFVGSVLTFENALPDYFYMVGTSLFLIKALISFATDIKNYGNSKNYEYDRIFDV